MKKTVKLLTKYFYALTTILFLAVTPANANMVDAGEEPGAALSAIDTILWFVVTPTAVWAIVWFLWSIPKWRRTNEPKTGENWNPKPSTDVVNH